MTEQPDTPALIEQLRSVKPYHKGPWLVEACHAAADALATAEARAGIDQSAAIFYRDKFRAAEARVAALTAERDGIDAAWMAALTQTSSELVVQNAKVAALTGTLADRDHQADTLMSALAALNAENQRQRDEIDDHWYGIEVSLRAALDSANATVVAVQALCDDPAMEAGHQVTRTWVHVKDIRAALAAAGGSPEGTTP